MSAGGAPRVLTLVGPRRVQLLERKLPSLGPADLRLRSLASAISHGTELNLYRGTSPFADKYFDPELRTFVSAGNAGGYPIDMGYEMVSEVIEVGHSMSGFVIGDIVQSRTPHQEEAIVSPAELLQAGRPLVKLRGRQGYERGLFVSLGSVGLQAVHDARLNLGDSVAVFGLGVIGLLVVQLARLGGARCIVAVDPVASRRVLAEHFGASHTIDPSAGPAGRAIKQFAAAHGVDAAIETSGTSSGLHEAVASTAVRGRIVTVGFYRGGANGLRLGEEWHHNAPTMVSSMSGWGCPLPDHPRWHPERLTQTVVDLLFDDELSIDSLLGSNVAFDDAPEAYAALDANPTKELKLILRYGPEAR